MYHGWQIREQHELKHTRLIAVTILNSRMGLKPNQRTRPERWMHLPEIDGYKKVSAPREGFDEFIKRITEQEIKAGRLKPGSILQLAKVTQE